jgi:LysM repeat protein
MNNTTHHSTYVERCPFIGLPDDRSTSLAYPSVWNYCYHAAPPTSIHVSHQAGTCLCPHYTECAIYRSTKSEPLPSPLRGNLKLGVLKYRPLGAQGRSVLLLLLVTLLALTIFLGPGFLFGPARDVTPSISAASNYPASNDPPDQNGAGLPNGQPQTSLATSSILYGGASTGVTQWDTLLSSTEKPPQTLEIPSTGSPKSSQTATLTSTPEGTCGHALDAPFGKNTKFVVHRVMSGENLTLYAGQYHTTTDAILAVNYHLPMPVWEDWIIVIPVDTLDVSDIPPFEPYQAIGTRISLGELAKQLNTDPQSLYRYNSFEGACQVFSGWLLVPRKPLESE